MLKVTLNPDNTHLISVRGKFCQPECLLGLYCLNSGNAIVSRIDNGNSPIDILNC